MFELFKTLLGSGNKAASLLLEARQELVTTLDQAHGLLAEAQPQLGRPTSAGALAQRARSVDKSSNKSERTIRKLLVEHVAFNQADAPACLVLMSCAKDAERLVDECRNVIDIAELIRTPLPEAALSDLDVIAKDVITALASVRTVFANNDEAGALALVESERPFVQRVTALSDRILDDDSLGSRRAVLLWRSFRGLRRIHAHLANIASTVVFPVHRIDFAKRAYIEDARRDLGLGPR